MSYGFNITWRQKNGETSVTVRGRDTLEEAKQDCIESAKHFGWTNPKWWQWWRWGDTRVILAQKETPILTGK